MEYWITTSNWYTERIEGRPCSGAMQRNERHIWWYDRDRDNNIQVSDMVLVYQTGENREAHRENIEIAKELKCSFIGNFTVGRLWDRDDPAPNGCHEEPDNDWLESVEHNFLWEQHEIIKRKDIDDELLKRITDSKNVGLVFRNKTWIRLEGRDGFNYYNRVMNRHHNQP